MYVICMHPNTHTQILGYSEKKMVRKKWNDSSWQWTTFLWTRITPGHCLCCNKIFQYNENLFTFFLPSSSSSTSQLSSFFAVLSIASISQTLSFFAVNRLHVIYDAQTKWCTENCPFLRTSSMMLFLKQINSFGRWPKQLFVGNFSTRFSFYL